MTIAERLKALEDAEVIKSRIAELANIRAEVEAVAKEIKEARSSEWKDSGTGVMRMRGIAWPHELDEWADRLAKDGVE